MQIKGTVDSVTDKVITSKAGKRFKVHYVVMDDGQEVNVGFKQPFAVGQYVTLDVEQKFGELKMLSSSNGNAQAVSKSAPASGSAPRPSASSRPFPVPKTSGEMAIIRQNALTNAVTMFCNGALEFVPGKDEMKSTDELIEEVLKMAYKFAEFSSGQREVALASNLAERASKQARRVIKDEDEADDE